MCTADPYNIIDQAAFRWKRLFLLGAGFLNLALNSKPGEISYVTA